MADDTICGVRPTALNLLAQAQPEFQQPTRTNLESSAQRFYIKSAVWSPDGTCVIANGVDNHIRNYVVPPDLLEPRNEPLNLEPYCSISSFESVNALACYPGFDLQDPSTTLVLSAAREHPLRLNSVLTGQLVASYPLVSPTTEAYIVPHSLVFTPDGRKIVAGSDTLLSVFDASRTGEGPLAFCKTGPKNTRSGWSNPTTAVRGFVSALDIDKQHNILAAGTLSRQIGLYDAAGEGECIGAFSIQGTEADEHIGGGGITQVKWSSCGRYLYIAERKSDGILVYDIRGSGQLLAWCEGRKAKTNQRMQIEIVENSTGEAEVLAGGSDGCVRSWKAPHLQQGAVLQNEKLKVSDSKRSLLLLAIYALTWQVSSIVSRCTKVPRFLLLLAERDTLSL